MLTSWQKLLGSAAVCALPPMMASCTEGVSSDSDPWQTSGPAAEVDDAAAVGSGGSGGHVGGGGSLGKGGTGGSGAGAPASGSGGGTGTAGSGGSGSSTGSAGSATAGGAGGKAGSTGSAGGGGVGGKAAGPSHSIAGVRMFPEGSVFETPIDALPVHAKSAEWIKAESWDLKESGGKSKGPGYVVTGSIIPLNVVNDTSAKYYNMRFKYNPQSDFCWNSWSWTAYCPSSAKYPIPNPFYAETDPGASVKSDGHLFVLNTDTKLLYEIFTIESKVDENTLNAQSGAIFDLASDKLRGAYPGTTNPSLDGHSYAIPRASAGMGGLPMTPLFFSYDETSTEIDHALYVDVPWASVDSYVWPARAAFNYNCGKDGGQLSHNPGQTKNHHLVDGVNYECPPFGARIRLKASFNIEAYRTSSPQSYAIMKALQKYGAIIGDNAFLPFKMSDPNEHRVWYLQALGDIYVNGNKVVSRSGFTGGLGALVNIKSTDLEFVDESSLMRDDNSQLVK
jgi:hypothetical protein